MKKVVYQPWHDIENNRYGFSIYRSMESCDSFCRGWVHAQYHMGGPWRRNPGMKLYTFIPDEWYDRLYGDNDRYISIALYWRQIPPSDVYGFLLQKGRIRLLRSINEIEEERYERRA